MTRLSNRCVDGECRCGMSPECNPRSLERHCLAFDWTRPKETDTTATCKSGMTYFSVRCRKINYQEKSSSNKSYLTMIHCTQILSRKAKCKTTGHYE